MIPAYLINLDRRPDRLEFVSKQLDALSTAWERVSALDGHKIGIDKIRKQLGIQRSRMGIGGGGWAHSHRLRTDYCVFFLLFLSSAFVFRFLVVRLALAGILKIWRQLIGQKFS